MSRNRGPVLPLEQKCVEPGRWIIGGRSVRAVYQGRSRNILCWNVEALPGDSDQPISGFLYLSDVRDWIRDQETGGDHATAG